MDIKSVTQQVVDYVQGLKFSDIPQRTVKQQEHSVNDMLACMLAATSLDRVAPKVADYAKLCPGNCTILYDGSKASAEMAALANGVLSHAIDFDDSHDALVHPSGVIFPVALALAEYLGDVSGEEFITALVIGTDLSCRFAMAITANTQPFGWNIPAIVETLGAVFGAAKLMRLSSDEMQDAVAMAMTQFTCSGESLYSKGSVIRTMREGFAAQAVVQSVIMAKYGLSTKFDAPIEGKAGFYTMYARGNVDYSKITDGLGVRFETDNITYKPWPSCKTTHTPIQGLLEIMNENSLCGDDIEEVHLLMQETANMTLEPVDAKLHPQSVAMAKVSMPFVLGTIMKDRALNLTSFTEEKLSDSEIIKHGSKITFEYSPEWTKDQNQFLDIEVKSKKGNFKRHLETSMGGTGYPLTDEQVKDKFISCCNFYRRKKNDEQVKCLFEASANAASLKNVNELLALL